jgi:hypothetical protein
MRKWIASLALLAAASCSTSKAPEPSATPERNAAIAPSHPSTDEPSPSTVLPEQRSTAAATPLSKHEKELLDIYLDDFAVTKELAAKGQLTNASVDGRLACDIVMKRFDRYRASGDPDAKQMLAEAPELCGCKVPRLAASAAISDAKKQGDTDWLERDASCETADSYLTLLEANCTPSPIELRYEWAGLCPDFLPFSRVDELLKQVQSEDDLGRRLDCEKVDSRLSKLEKARTEERFGRDDLAKRRATWRRACPE